MENTTAIPPAAEVILAMPAADEAMTIANAVPPREGAALPAPLVKIPLFLLPVLKMLNGIILSGRETLKVCLGRIHNPFTVYLN